MGRELSIFLGGKECLAFLRRNSHGLTFQVPPPFDQAADVARMGGREFLGGFVCETTVSLTVFFSEIDLSSFLK